MSSEPPDLASGQKTVIMNLTENKSPTMWIPSKQQKPYQCGLCSVMFDINIELIFHVKKHSLTKPYQCGYCQVSFDSNVELTLHHGKAHVRALFVITPERSKTGVVSPTDGGEGCLLPPPATQSASISSEHVLLPKTCTVGDVSDDFKSNKKRVTKIAREIKPEAVELPYPNQHCDDELNVHFEEDSKTSRTKVHTPDSKIKLSDSTHVNDSELDYNPSVRILRDASVCQAAKSSIKRKTSGRSLGTTKSETCFQCPCCEKVLSTKATLRFHMDTVHADEKLFVCKLCSRGFNYVKSYQEHMACIHTDSKRFPCSLCPARLKTKVRLYNHTREKHSLKKFQCAECKQRFKFKCDLRKHWCKPRKCSLCDKMLISKVTYRIHMMRKHHAETDPEKIKNPGTEELSHQCAECMRCYRSKSNLRKHWCQPRKCTHCDIMLSSKDSYKTHMMLKHGTEETDPGLEKNSTEESLQQQYQCAECKRCYKYKCALNQHWCKPRKCSVCDIMLTSKLTYKNHMVRKHASETETARRMHQCPECKRSYKYKCDLSQHWCKPRKCSICDKMLTSNLTYKYHMLRMHNTKIDSVKKQKLSAEKPASVKKKPGTEKSSHLCTECGRCFNCKGDLNRHWCKPRNCSVCDKTLASSSGYRLHMMRMHTAEKPFQCSHCEKAFAYKRDLAQHSRVHADIKAYICEFCGKSYGTSDGLKYHRNSHSNSTPYKCRLCPKEFSSRPSQDMHERRHIGDKRYTCGQCDKKFYTSGALQRHALSHTDLHAYVCEVCSKTYRSPSALGYHLKHFHHL